MFSLELQRSTILSIAKIKEKEKDEVFLGSFFTFTTKSSRLCPSFDREVDRETNLTQTETRLGTRQD